MNNNNEENEEKCPQPEHKRAGLEQCEHKSQRYMELKWRRKAADKPMAKT